MDEQEFETNINRFLIIWDDYINFLSVQPFELEIFIGVIDRIKMKQSICIEDKKTFVKLIELMADAIYKVNGYANHIYDQQELKCCYSLIQFLQTDIIWNLNNCCD